MIVRNMEGAFLKAAAVASLSLHLVPAPLLAQAEGAGSAPPALSVVLIPEGSDPAQQRMGVSMQIAAPAIAAGKPLLRMPYTLVGTPTARYDASAIEARDDKGPLTLSHVDEAPGPSGTYRNYLASRATVGDVHVRYSTPPRPVNSETRNGPLFDLRGEAGGLIGAGVYFFALPARSEPYSIRVRWDLSKMPAGARGASSLGEGPQDLVAPAEALAFNFYAAGPLKSDPADGQGDFAFYWLKQPPFDPVRFGEDARKLYHAMADYFGDADASYRVFVRANPYPSGGGTSLGHSFMFGYGSNGYTTDTGPEMLVAHEMAHTWPKMDGEHASTAWYSEGTAEYFSVLLSLKAGAIDAERFLELINQKTENYFTNPHRALSNADVGAIFWKDARAQRVPYERGFLYLSRVNGQLLEKSGGKRRVGDLVREVLDRQRKGEKIGTEQWVEIVERELGPRARADFEAMAAGKVMEPVPGAFGPCYRAVKARLRPFDLGFDAMRLGVVKDLRADSPAAAAGVREDDVILSMTSLDALRADPDARMVMKIERGGRAVDIRFSPRGAVVDGWKWERIASVPEQQCDL